MVWSGKEYLKKTGDLKVFYLLCRSI
jgi:hypothetical protein